MAKLVTIKAPVLGGGFTEVQGNVIWLNVGYCKIKFLIQYNPDAYMPQKYLTHFASGRKVGMSPFGQNVPSYINGYRPTDREKAKELIYALEKQYGTDNLLSVLNKAEVINGGSNE